MIRDLINNLSRNQKIVIAVIVQAIVIITLVLVFQNFTGQHQHVFIEQGSVVSEELPEDVNKFVSSNIWQVIQQYVPGANKDNIKDVVIREDSYEEGENEDESVWANFIVDIDSLKQTYRVSTAWSKNENIVYETTVSCPPQNLMKYPETVCYSPTNNTYSLNLYLPYIIYPEGADDEDSEPLAPSIMITEGNANKTIDVMISACDEDKFKKEAQEYLNSTPIKLDEYTINYEVNTIDTGC